MKATIRLSVEKGKPWVKSPHYLTPAESDEEVKTRLKGRGEYAALGIDADLREASRKALRGMIEVRPFSFDPTLHTSFEFGTWSGKMLTPLVACG